LFTGELENLKNDKQFLQSLCFRLANIVHQLSALIVDKNLSDENSFNEFVDTISELFVSIQTQLLNISMELSNMGYKTKDFINSKSDVSSLKALAETMDDTINIIRSMIKKD